MVKDQRLKVLTIDRPSFAALNDYSKITSEAIYKTTYGEGLKILTPRQILQRLQCSSCTSKSR